MEELTVGGLAVTVGFAVLAMANPFLLAPAFVGLTQGFDKGQQRATALTAVVVAGGILIGSILIGQVVLNLFGITIPALQVAGGLIFLSMGFGMLGSNSNRVSTDSDEEEAAGSKVAADTSAVAIVPLAIPMMAGPGLIAVMIGVSATLEDTMDVVAVGAGAIVALLIVYALLLISPRLMNLLGKSGIDLLTKLMGLIILALGVTLTVAGLGSLLPGLAA